MSLKYMIGNIPEKGYLFMEEYHPPGYDGATGDTVSMKLLRDPNAGN